MHMAPKMESSIIIFSECILQWNSLVWQVSRVFMNSFNPPKIWISFMHGFFWILLSMYIYHSLFFFFKLYRIVLVLPIWDVQFLQLRLWRKYFLIVWFVKRTDLLEEKKRPKMETVELEFLQWSSVKVKEIGEN